MMLIYGGLHMDAGRFLNMPNLGYSTHQEAIL
jgi:hypothetical protein